MADILWKSFIELFTSYQSTEPHLILLQTTKVGIRFPRL